MVFGVGLSDDASLSLSRCFSFLAVVSLDSPFFSSLYVLLLISLLSTITTFPFPFLALSLSLSFTTTIQRNSFPLLPSSRERLSTSITTNPL